MNKSTTIWPGFLASLKSEQTRKIYEGNLREYLQYAGKGDLYDTTPADGDAYYQHLLHKVRKGELSTRTMNDKLYRLKSISAHALAMSHENNFTDPFYRVIAHNPPHRELLIPAYEDMKDLLARTEEDASFCIFLQLILYCGLSVSEGLRITGTDVRPTRLRIMALGHTREISLPDKLHQELWILRREAGVAQPIFRNRLNHPYNARYVERTLLKYGTYTPQQLRNFALTSMYAQGIDDKTFTAYTGIVRPEYFKRFRNAAQGLTKTFDYSHILLRQL